MEKEGGEEVNEGDAGMRIGDIGVAVGIGVSGETSPEKGGERKSFGMKIT